MAATSKLRFIGLIFRAHIASATVSTALCFSAASRTSFLPNRPLKRLRRPQSCGQNVSVHGRCNWSRDFKGIPFTRKSKSMSLRLPPLCVLSFLFRTTFQLVNLFVLPRTFPETRSTTSPGSCSLVPRNSILWPRASISISSICSRKLNSAFPQEFSKMTARIRSKSNTLGAQNPRRRRSTASRPAAIRAAATPRHCSSTVSTSFRKPSVTGMFHTCRNTRSRMARRRLRISSSASRLLSLEAPAPDAVERSCCSKSKFWRSSCSTSSAVPAP